MRCTTGDRVARFNARAEAPIVMLSVDSDPSVEDKSRGKAIGVLTSESPVLGIRGRRMVGSVGRWSLLAARSRRCSGGFDVEEALGISTACVCVPAGETSERRWPD